MWNSAAARCCWARFLAVRPGAIWLIGSRRIGRLMEFPVLKNFSHQALVLTSSLPRLKRPRMHARRRAFQSTTALPIDLPARRPAHCHLATVRRGVARNCHSFVLKAPHAFDTGRSCTGRSCTGRSCTGRSCCVKAKSHPKTSSGWQSGRTVLKHYGEDIPPDFCQFVEVRYGGVSLSTTAVTRMAKEPEVMARELTGLLAAVHRAATEEIEQKRGSVSNPID